MHKRNYNYAKLFILASVLPFIYGCGTDAGVGSLIGFLFDGSAGSLPEIALLNSADVFGSSGAGVATLTQPEPASMLLIGGGLMAMGYFKSKTNRRSK